MNITELRERSKFEGSIPHEANAAVMMWAADEIERLRTVVKENQPETAEPKPRWRDRTDSDTYTVRNLDSAWVIYFDPNNSGESRRTDNKQMAGTFFTEQKANTCLDNCLGSSPNWERCDEEEEESDDEVLAEIMKLRDKLRLGVIFGLGDGLWGIKENNGAGIDIGAAHTFPELRDILRVRAEPSPVTNEEVKEAFRQTERGNDGREVWATVRRFFKELP